MLTRIDHVMICVPDLQEGIDAYTKIGFDVRPGGVHPGRGTHNAISFLQEDYVELMSVRDADEYRKAAGASGGLLDFLGKGGGFRFVAVQSSDLEADVAAMRARGVDVGDASAGGRTTPDGKTLRWKSAQLGPRNPLPIFFIEHLTPVEERRRKFSYSPNLLLVDGGKAQLNVAVNVVEELGLADEIAVAALAKRFEEVYLPGQAAEALARRGPGPFQALYRTTSMDTAVRWMTDHGMPAPARGVRNTGEHAILVAPEHAGGAYIGFVGPA